MLFQLLQPPLELARLDRPDIHLDHVDEFRRLAGRNRTLRHRLGLIFHFRGFRRMGSDPNGVFSICPGGPSL